MLSRQNPGPGSNPEPKPFESRKVQELVTERLVLIDSEERVRAELRILDDGEPAIAFYDRHGQERVRLGLKKQWFDDYQEEPPGTEAELTMTGDDNEGHGARVELSVGGTASAEFGIYGDRNDADSTRAFIEVLEEEAVFVTSNGKTGTRFGISGARMTLESGK